MLMKNMPAGSSTTVQIIAFTPRPRRVKMLLTPSGSDTVMMGEAAVPAGRVLIQPQPGLFASRLGTHPPRVQSRDHGGGRPRGLGLRGPQCVMRRLCRGD